MFTVRLYTPADYDDFVRIDAATQSTAYWSEADWQPIHPPQDATHEARRYVAVHSESSQVIGYGAVLMTQQSNLDVLVHPDWQRRGVGTLLWEQMRRDLSPFGQVTVGPWVRAANTGASRWLLALGFSLVHQEGAVQLSVGNADLSPLAGVAQQVAQRGITITTLAAEKKAGTGDANDQECLAQLYDIFQEVEQDVPGNSLRPRTTYEQCMYDLEQPGMLPESIFIAKHGSRYIGLSILGRKVTESDVRFAGPNTLSQHLTGVRRAYWRRGIALALKLCTVEYARQHGFERIVSNSDNPAMQALNGRLGFRPGPWLVYNKVLG